MDKKKYQAYIKEKLHPLLEKMLIDCLHKQPSEPIPFMIEWLQKKQSEGAGAGSKHGQESETSKQQQISKQPSSSQHQKKVSKQKKETEDEEEVASSDQDEDDDDYIDQLPQKQISKDKPPAARVSVSAEAFGQFNQKKAFKARVIPKKPEQIEKITKRLSQAFMFSALEDYERKIVIDAMEERKFKAGEWVIQQGEDGDVLYVVDEGELDCEKVFKRGDQATYLKTYQPGESFGELALLYNAPRAASIKAKTSAILYALDRDTFNNIVKDAAAKKRERYESFLTKIEILKEMDPYERSKIGDALRSVTFKQGEFVLREGENGDDFFMVEEGKLQALKSTKPGGDPVAVKDYKEGDYFGELALLKNVPRQASIQCNTNVKLVTLDRLAFKRLLGPVDAILARNADSYHKHSE